VLAIAEDLASRTTAGAPVLMEAGT
jgi:hypothetical protein